MKEKKTIYFVVLSLSVLLLFSRALPAEPMRVTENLRREKVLLPPSAPDKGQLILVSFVTIATEAEIIAAVATHDDPQTKRPVDYMELYDGSGGLLLVSWIDRFGIRRTAMDRALLQGGGPRLEGILVLVAEGTPS